MKKRYSFFSKTWLRASLFAGIAASFSLNLQAQIAPTKVWDKTLGGNSDDSFTSLLQTSDGGYILGGFTDSGISGDKSQDSKGNKDYWVVKLDDSGNIMWDKTFGGNDFDDLRSVQQTSDGGYILGGSSMSGMGGDKSQASRGDHDYWVVKLDDNGNEMWDKTFGGIGYDALRSLQQTSDGGYILGGTSTSGISGDKSQASLGNDDYWIVKLDANGNKTWDKTFGGSDNDLLRSLQQTSDGGYILGGTSTSGMSGDKSQYSQGDEDYWVVKLDSSGTKTWDKTIGGSSSDGLNSLQQASDGGYILGGYSYSDISGNKSQPNKGSANLDTGDYWVIKLDTLGNKSWDRTLGGIDNDEAAVVQQTPDGGFIVGGYSNSYIGGDKSQACQGGWDYWVLKLDAVGYKVWDKTIGGGKDDFLYSLQQTSDGGFMLGGFSYSDISIDKTEDSKGKTDYWLVKIGGNPLGLKESETSLAASIFPNPSQGKFKLQLSGITAPSVGVTVSDLLGRVVLQQDIQATDQHISQELTLPSAKGIYLLKLKAGEQITTRKIVVE